MSRGTRSLHHSTLDFQNDAIFTCAIIIFPSDVAGLSFASRYKSSFSETVMPEKKQP